MPDLRDYGRWANVCFPNPYQELGATEVNDRISEIIGDDDKKPRVWQLSLTEHLFNAFSSPDGVQDAPLKTTDELYTIYKDFSYDVSVTLMSNQSCLPEAFTLTEDDGSAVAREFSPWTPMVTR